MGRDVAGDRARRFALATLCGAVLACAQGAAAGESALPAGSAGAGMAVVSGIRLAGDARQTRLVVELSRPVEMRAFMLADPYRVVIDLPQVDFQVAAGTGERGHGLVKTFRYGLVTLGGSRIVVDAGGPVRIAQAAPAAAAAGAAPARFVLELTASDRASVLREIAVQNRGPTSAHGAINAAAGARSDADLPLIMLDPGHGGIDTGTRAAGGETEKTIVLDIALMLRDKLEKTGRYRVALTRSDDTFVSLPERVRMARAAGAALFISIHCDALARGEGEAQGATVYTLSEAASDHQAARLADNENKADVIAGVDLSEEPQEIVDILIDLAQRETKTFSVQFAKTLVGELKPAVRLHRHPLKSAGFRVLRAPDVPSILIELGYVSNRGDLRALTSSAWRARAGDAIVLAIDSFFTPRLAGARAPRAGR
ncbi:MAG: N-acetylmuramoyl-L-alanine amidase [Proteobacteria bacterium]|nr:N-acetylmuramoyl-L-alanine amidase [Pseudomonadota bacterium]